MAETNKFIGELDDGGTVAVGDKIPVERDVDGTPTNFYVVPGTAGTKAASDATKDTVASVDGATNPGHMAVFSDTFGTVEDGGLPSAIITGVTSLPLPAITSDLIPIVRSGQIYLSTIADILAAQPPSGTGGQFDFSDPNNSSLYMLL